MRFNRHLELKNKHSFLSPSSYHWLRYDVEKLRASYISSIAQQRGIDLHNLASELIRLNVSLPKTHKTLNMYVNDAIGYRMTPEQGLYFSPNCFGTADAISYRRSLLRIHDLKTGVTPASMDQLRVYAALFFLEYGNVAKLEESKIELRIYQSNDILVDNPETSLIKEIMNHIILLDKELRKLKEEV